MAYDVIIKKLKMTDVTQINLKLNIPDTVVEDLINKIVDIMKELPEGKQKAVLAKIHLPQLINLWFGGKALPNFSFSESCLNLCMGEEAHKCFDPEGDKHEVAFLVYHGEHLLVSIKDRVNVWRDCSCTCSSRKW